MDTRPAGAYECARVTRSHSIGPSAAALAAAVIAASLVAGCASAPARRSAVPITGASVPATTGAAPSATPNGPTHSVQTTLDRTTRQVIATERAFARTMADRNFKAFLSYLSPDAVFFSGNRVQHGPAEIAAEWEPYFSGRVAPFSWHPDHVEVLADGRLALSTGPLIEHGQVVGRFDSVWRLEAPGTWHIVFDKGEPVCGAPAASGAAAAPTTRHGPEIIVTQ